VSSDLPNQTEYPYAGWVPTANGQLSFRHIGESANPTPAIYANATTDKERVVLAYQHRPLSDALFGRPLQWLMEFEDSFYFILATTSVGPPGDTDEMRGAIYIYKTKSDWVQNGRGSTRPKLRQIRNLALSLDIDRYDQIRTLYQQAVNDLQGTADIDLKFVLLRSGETFFSKPSFRFFLRDLTHHHQHHAPSSDTILTLQYRGADDFARIRHANSQDKVHTTH
jgi:hypothetical protein